MYLTFRLRILTLALGLAIAVAIFDAARYLIIAKP